MVSLFIFMIGVVLAILMIALMNWSRIGTDRGTWATIMVAISIFYVVFAIEHDMGIIQHILLASLFILLTVIGARYYPWLIVLALIGHGVFDVTIHLFAPNPSPSWWAPFCLGVDIVLGIWLARLLKTKRMKLSS